MMGHQASGQERLFSLSTLKTSFRRPIFLELLIAAYFGERERLFRPNVNSYFGAL